MARVIELLKLLVKILPMAVLGIKAAFAMWKARIKQKALKEALENERDRRIDAEGELDLDRRRSEPLDDRRRRIRNEARQPR